MSQVQNVNSINQAISNIKYIEIAYSQIHKSFNNLDLLLVANSNQSSLAILEKSITNLNDSGLIQVALKYFENTLISPRTNTELNVRKSFTKLMLFFGKLYRFSSVLNLKDFYSKEMLRNGLIKIGEEYLFFLTGLTQRP